MKGISRDLFGKAGGGLTVVILAVTILLAAGQQPLFGWGGSGTAAPQPETSPDVAAFQSPLAPIAPTPTPMRAADLRVASRELISTGPYQNILWSPDGKMALVTKQYTQYLLRREQGVSPDEIPSGVVLGTTVGLGDLWLWDLATGKETLLLDQVGRYTWSPDGTQVAYLAPTEGEGIAGALMVLDVAGGESRQVTTVDFLGSDYEPQWLPSGEIVFVRDGQLWMVLGDSQEEKALPGLRFSSWVGVENGKTEYGGDRSALLGFRFSPDGKRLAYKGYGPNERAIAYDLWLANADGRDPILVTHQAEGSYYEWSPDGQWLVFNTYRDVDDPTWDEHLPSVSGLWVVRADGSDVHPLHKSEGWRWILAPTWSPDSRVVVFVDSLLVDKPDSPRQTYWQGSLAACDVQDGTTFFLKGVAEDEEAPADVWWSPDGGSLYTLRDGEAIDAYLTDHLFLAAE